MKKQNLIWLAVGGLAVYLLLSMKKKSGAKTTTSGGNGVVTPPAKDLTDSQFAASMFSNEELLDYYKNRICSFRGGTKQLIREMPPSKEKLEMDAAVKAELAKRNLTGKCIDYGMFPPPTQRK
jgi:hypothetical protein